MFNSCMLLFCVMTVPSKEGVMGACRSAMIEGMVSIPLHIGLPVFHQHLLPVMTGFLGMPYLGKSAVIATPPATQLLPVYRSDLLEGLPVPIG